MKYPVFTKRTLRGGMNNINLRRRIANEVNKINNADIPKEDDFSILSIRSKTIPIEKTIAVEKIIPVEKTREKYIFDCRNNNRRKRIRRVKSSTTTEDLDFNLFSMLR